MNNSQDSGQLENTCVLVVDDEAALRNLLRVSLQRIDYTVYEAANGEEALALFDANQIDLVLLDVVMPGMDGFETCTELRKRSDVPIVMLTALNRPDDIVRGFNLGADDYITKPFSFREVEVRLQAIMRRMSWLRDKPEAHILELGDIVLDDEIREVIVRGKPVHLTPIEYQLMHRLMSAPDRPIDKAELFRSVWGYDLIGGNNLVEVTIRRLRSKIEIDPSNPICLLTVRGVGYKFSTALSQPDVSGKSKPVDSSGADQREQIQ